MMLVTAPGHTSAAWSAVGSATKRAMSAARRGTICSAHSAHHVGSGSP